MERKTSYLEAPNQDFFIVRLLRTEIQNVIEEWNKKGTGTVLDVGCGGQPLKNLLETKGFRYYSADIAPSGSIQPDFLFSLEDQLPETILKVAPFSYVICTEVLEHISNWEIAFRHLAQLVAENGEILITSPFVYPRHEEPHDYFRATPQAFLKLAEKNGFNIVALKQAGAIDEVLGTVVGFALYDFNYLNGKKAKNPVHRIRQRLLRGLLELIWYLCRQNAYREFLCHTRLFYLANIVRLKKHKCPKNSDRNQT